jgi:hypothetical protein
LFDELMASRSDRGLPNLVGCKAREADGLMTRRRANFHYGWNEMKFRLEAEYMPATGYQISTATTLRTGLGPYMHPKFPAFIKYGRLLWHARQRAQC